MGVARKTVRQSVSLPANVAAEVRRIAKGRRLSANRVLLELIENGIDAEKRKEQQFFELAEQFRSATDPADVKRLGDEWPNDLRLIVYSFSYDMIRCCRTGSGGVR